MNLQYLLEQLRDRFYGNTKQTSDHWQWKGLYDAKNRPRIFLISRWIDGQSLSYILSKGEIPPGHRVITNCGVTSCVRPDHLFVEEIPRDIPIKLPKLYKVKPDGSPSGNFRSIKTKLTPDQQYEIVKEYNSQDTKWGYQGILAKKWNVSPSLISVTIKKWNDQGIDIERILEQQRALVSGNPLALPELNTVGLLLAEENGNSNGSEDEEEPDEEGW